MEGRKRTEVKYLILGKEGWSEDGKKKIGKGMLIMRKDRISVRI